MKKNADTVLWTERKFQCANGIGRGSPLYVNQESWNHFLFWLHRHEGFVTHDFSPNLTTRSYHTCYHNLTSQSVPLRTNIFRLVAESEGQFECLRELFGTSDSHGVRCLLNTKKWCVVTVYF